MALNVVEILVTAKNETQAAFAEADASATGFSKALKTSLIAGAGAAAILGYESVKMATNFQASMTQLNTQAGVPKSALKGLQQGVLQLAGQVGFSPSSLAESLYHVASNMASLGGTAPQMLNVVKVAAEGAKIGGADLVDVTNALTAAVASGIPGVKNYSQAMGILNATVGAGDMKMQDLADAMGTGVLAIGKQFGLTMRDAGAALATFGDNNIRGAKAGTELRMAIMDLAVQSKAGQGVLAGLGIKAGELGAKMRSGGLISAVSDLRAKLIAAKVPATEWGTIMTEAFTKKAAAPLAILLGQFDRLKSKYPAMDKGAQDFGKAWATTNDTLKQKLDELRGKFDAVMVSVGEKLIPVLTRLAGWILSTLIPAIGSIVRWMSKHKDIVIAVAAGIVAMLIPAFVAWAVAAGSAAIATIAAAAPLILIAAGVALVVYAILQLAHHWKAIWRDIKQWTMDAVNAVRHIWDRMIRDIEHWVGDVINFIKQHWPLLLAILTGPIGLAVLFIVDHWKQIVAGAKRMWSDIVGFFKRLPGDILHALGNLGHLLWNAGIDVIKGLIGGIESMFGGLFHTIGSLASGIGHVFSSVLHIFSPSKVFDEHGRNIVRGLVQGINAEAPTAINAMRNLGIAGLPGGVGARGYGAASGAGRLQIEFVGGDGPIIEAFKNAIRIRGGGGPNSVQIALGQNH